MERNFYSVADIQRELGIGRRNAYELVARADFPALRIGKRIVIPVKQFEDWVEKQTQVQ